MPPVKKAAVAAPAGGSVNFGDPGFYVGGSDFALQPGRYALEFFTQMITPTKADGKPSGKPAFLAVNVVAHPLNGGEPQERAFSLGSKAHLSFVPSANGKGLDPVANAPSATGSDISNWGILYKSMQDCGLPEGVFVNDLTTIDGIWVVTALVDEPESRKNMKNNRTGEAAEEPRKPQKTAVVVEILDDGKPWEGTGGIPDADAPVKAKTVVKVPVKPVVGAKKVAAPAPVEEEEVEAEAGDEDVEAAAMAACGDVLVRNPEGCPRVKMRVEVMKFVKENHGDDMAQAVQNTYMVSDEALNVILGQFGYVAANSKITVA